jgi:hypothetical protein
MAGKRKPHYSRKPKHLIIGPFGGFHEVPPNWGRDRSRDEIIKMATRFFAGACDEAAASHAQDSPFAELLERTFSARQAQFEEMLFAIAADKHALWSMYQVLWSVYELGLVAGVGEIKQKSLRRQLESIARATEARRHVSKSLDMEIARLAGPILKAHPKYSSNRIAAMLRDSLNQHLPRPLAVDAIRKRLKKIRTIGRPSD